METPVTKPSSVLYASLAATPPRIESANGNYLFTEDGARIFDASGGAAVACIGHNNSRVKQALATQLDKISYCFSPWFSTSAYENLAQYLTASTNGVMEKVFVVGSGAEAVEAALKMARQYFLELPEPQPQRCRFIARDRSYHGNTLGSLSLSGHKARRTPFEPILSQQFSHVSPCYPYRGKKEGESDDLYTSRLVQELEDEFQRVGPANVCGFVAETVAGLTLGGVAATPGYLKAMKAVCDRHGALFILDEVMAGMGRTGTLHAWEQEDVVPHLQTVAKGLGAGYAAIGALLVHKDVVDVFTKGTKAFVHFQTYHGHPLACAAAYEVQQVIKDEDLVENCRRMGVYMGKLLKQRLGSHQHVGGIRGRGLLWGVELVKDKTTKQPFPAGIKVAPTIHAAGLNKFSISLIPGGGVADGTNGDVMVITPAYNITETDAQLIVEKAAVAIEHVLGPSRSSKL